MEQVANQQAYPYNLFPEADQLSLTYSNRYSPKGPKPLLIPVASCKCIELNFLLPEFKFIFTKSHERWTEVSITHTVYRYWPEIW